MVINIGIAVGASIVALVAASVLAKTILGGGPGFNLLMQFTAMAAVAGLLLKFGIIAGWLSIILLVTLPVTLRVITYTILLLSSIRALRGGYGEETRWAAELFKEGDKEFIEATKALPKTELRELAIIAESKEGLRNLTIERYEELKGTETLN